MKKVRGWKRKVRHLGQWKEDNRKLDLNFLKQNKVEYIKIFNYIGMDQTPDWYKHKVAMAFLELYQSWKEAAETTFNQYYIRIHINEENVFNSEVMIVTEDQIEAYKNKFIKGDKKDIPAWLEGLSKRWVPYYQCTVWLEEEINSLSDPEKDDLLKKVLEIKIVPSYDGTINKEYLIKEGTIWCLIHEGNNKYSDMYR